MQELLAKARRAARKPPRYIVSRLVLEARAEAERYWGPRRARRFDTASLLAETGANSLSELWERLQSNPYVACTNASMPADYERICPGDRERILLQAEDALNHRVNLLGSGPIELGATIDWHRDYKTNLTWPLDHSRGLDYVNRERPSDVKFPWEVSRMQWLIPAGQAYLLTADERYALCVRDLLTQWIQANPYSYGINWGCTMEVALRILSWTWFFRVFANSQAWSETNFQQQFLRALFLHGVFTERHLEKSDVNGNHYTADAAGLVFAGLFFGTGRNPQHWLNTGWQILCDELPKQVFDDGVDFEASVPYHRLVLELFLLPALYRGVAGLQVPESYKARLAKMGEFVGAYSRNDGSVPLWGDNDDARALPFGGQAINDHRYVLGLLALTYAPELRNLFSGPRAEVFWLLGASAAESLPSTSEAQCDAKSAAFPNAGFYILRSQRDHVFIDCGPVGLAGRGGHGHNDLLSFEAVLDGVSLVRDCGSHVYTADFAERNHFRSTACHNTPLIGGEEINRFLGPNQIWTLQNDAIPQVRTWTTSAEADVFCGAHSGYSRLANPVTPVRTIVLDKLAHTLTVTDEFEGRTDAAIEVPLHLDPAMENVEVIEPGLVRIARASHVFHMNWGSPADWELSIERGRVSPTYGVVMAAKKLLWRRVNREAARLQVKIGRAE
ncbi:MAG: alginate lyase family protein [Acidobacteriaceae bacterium]|nr:alginate lyase family protein [Acidobacteriaceae bacterium]